MPLEHSRFSSLYITDPELRAGLDAIVYNSLRPVTTTLGALYAVFAVSHWYVLSLAVAVPMTVIATLSAFTLFLLRSVIIRRPLPITYASPFGTAIAAIVLLNCFAHIVFMPEPRHTTNLLLAVIGAGCFFLSADWFTLVLAIALGGWGLIVWAAPPSPDWLHFGFALFAATVVSVLIFHVRVQTYLRIERLRQNDIARQQQLEAALAASKEVERVKDELISAVNHELRTPLASLRGFTELLLAREFPPQKQKEIFTILQTESLRLTRLVDDFLDLQRMESGRQSYQLAEVALSPLIRESMAVFASDEGKHAWRVEIPDSLPLVRADADRIRQVLTNLFSNAMKFSPAGGTISVGARQQDGAVMVWVSDSGMGIPSEAIPRLFEKFFRVENTDTRRIGGTGLGLALAKKIVEEHHGRIWVESVPKQGSTFFFTLPTTPDNS